MNLIAIIAVTWIGQEHRLWGLDWSYLDLLGLIGQIVFSFRFFTQWIASERRRESIIPVSFWYWSIAGSLILCVYWIFKRSPIGIVANLPNMLIYLRNLHLIRKRKLALTAAAPSQTPREESE
ncbi:MAG: lipid-A-disaccharide synthase N-terminal domain-containing protein [Gammaproteobacteria bacterium]